MYTKNLFSRLTQKFGEVDKNYELFSIIIVRVVRVKSNAQQVNNLYIFLPVFGTPLQKFVAEKFSVWALHTKKSSTSHTIHATLTVS